MGTSRSSIPRGVAAIMVAALAVGIGLAAYLVQVKLRLEFDPTYVSSCNFGDKLDCDAVQTSEYATVFGYPLALFGLATYAALILVVLMALFWERCSRALHEGLVLAGILIVGHTIYLAALSSFVIGAYCVYCMGMYGVNVLVAGLAAWSYRKRWGRLFDVPALIANPQGPALALILGGAVLALGMPAYDDVREERKDARLAEVQKELQALEVPPGQPPESPEPGLRDRKSPAQRTMDAAKAPDPTRPMGTTQPRARVGDVVTRKGRSYYEVPVTDEDWILGPKDAPVTIVEFADFECGYCRMLTKNFEPLKEEYGDKVRWVFKHFPMDNTCNKVMKGTNHPKACDAARASNCAGEQGKFWEMHDVLFAHPHQLGKDQLRGHAEKAGVEDMARWDACFARTDPDHRIQRDTMLGRTARISGTPRMYINGHLVPGVHATEVLEYYIKAALEKAQKARAAGAGASAKVQHGMVEAKTAAGTFWIDAYEASLDADGRAMSRGGVMPALVSWFEARDACKAAGKRLCTEEEWISACTGTPAVDNDGDGNFSDDDVEGQMFPYGLFHEGGFCHDQEPKKGGKPQATGSFKKCRTPSGVFDQAGNVAEWTGATEETGVLTGPHFSYGQKAACRGRWERFGLGYRNQTTGFRCCADEPVRAVAGEASATAPLATIGQPAPDFEATSAKGKRVDTTSLKGKVTIVSFFASWCGPCRRELPELQELFVEHQKAGLEVLAIGVDTEEAKAREFAEGLNLTYTVAYDAQAISMGRWGVKAMPTAFLVDQAGVVQGRLIGMKRAEVDAFKAKAVALLAQP